MATFTWEVYADTPGWMDIGSNTVIFSGSASDLTAPVTVAAWQDGTHLGSGDPGTDQCGTNHVPNVKFISSTQFDNGGGTESLNDTNLVQTECTLRIRFTHGSSVTSSNVRFYAYDPSSGVGTEAVGVEAYAFEQGVSASSWTFINDDSTSYGGDNSGERLGLTGQGPATDHTFYIAISASPESVGGKTEFDFGIALTYS